MENSTKKKVITRSIVILGLVSLFTDIASEMLYPVTPIFLTSSLGASMALLGVIEGIAEAIAGFSKGYFGIMSDKIGKRKPFILIGYGLSAMLKPLPGIFISVYGVIISRFGDRIGKGFRTAPRDALLASYSDKENRGAVFGFHRGMDTIGAAIGPIIALLFLYFYPNHYREVFLLAFIPSVLAIVFALLVKEAPVQVVTQNKSTGKFVFWKEAPEQYKSLVILTTFFALFNSSDVFLILRAREIALSSAEIKANYIDVFAITSYILYNFVYAILSYPLGVIADKVGKKKIFTIGIGVFVLVYFLFAISESVLLCLIAFVLYGFYAAAVEGILKAWIADLVPNEKRGAAIGIQTATTSIAFIAASSLTGTIWTIFDSSAAFFLTSAAGLITFIVLIKSKLFQNIKK